MFKSKRCVAMLTAFMMAMLISGSVIAETNAKININTAGVEELVQLDRVGQKYAERIVAYRTENGPFKTPEEIMQVAGIGPRTFEANKDRIVVK